MRQPDVGNRWFGLWAQSWFPDVAGSVIWSVLEVGEWWCDSNIGDPALHTYQN